jgi:hypothetical protein
MSFVQKMYNDNTYRLPLAQGYPSRPVQFLRVHWVTQQRGDV